MKQSDLQPINAFASNHGVKAIVYGPPGQSKTPLIALTTPRPVICLTEPGANSLRDVSHVPAWNAVNAPERVAEFVAWAHTPDAAAFDTIIIDSGSEFAEASLAYWRDRMPKNKLGAYGEMATQVYNEFAKLYYLAGKHVIIICKETENDVDGVMIKRPYFPGQELNVKVPHLYDAVLRQAETNIPGVPQKQLAVRTKGTPGLMARARVSPNSPLMELEPPNYAAIFEKLMK